jgi:hypothetical protein
LTLFTDGSFSYTPDAGFHGVDSFTYSVSDGAFSSTAVATINVGTTGNNPPVTVDDSYSTLHDHQLVESAAAGVLANDSDPDGDTLTAILNGDGTTTHGHVSLASNGSFTYTPNAGYHGLDSFSYFASDGQAQTAGRCRSTSPTMRR